MFYRELKSHQGAVIHDDFIVKFCRFYINPKSRTIDQMIKTIRSNKQNILETQMQRTPKKSKLKLLGVTKAPQQKNFKDCEDFLRQQDLKHWSKNLPKAKAAYKLVSKTNKSLASKPHLKNPEDSANAMICLIDLFDHQIAILKEKFAAEGGWTEQIFQERLRKRRLLKTY